MRMSSVHIGGGYGDDSGIINRPSELTDAEVRGSSRLLVGFSNPVLTITPVKGERIVITNICIRNTDVGAVHYPIIWHNPFGGAAAAINIIYMMNLPASPAVGHSLQNILKEWIYLEYRTNGSAQPILTFGEVALSPLVAYNVYGFRVLDENKL